MNGRVCCPTESCSCSLSLDTCGATICSGRGILMVGKQSARCWERTKSVPRQPHYCPGIKKSRAPEVLLNPTRGLKHCMQLRHQSAIASPHPSLGGGSSQVCWLPWFL